MTLYGFARRFFRTFFQLKGWKIEGLENIPKKGPVILAVNHISNWDPVLVGCGLNRQVSYMAKEELFSVPFLGWAIRKVGAFPVNRAQADTGAIRQALAILKEDRVLGLFPEGTRSKTGDVQRALPGVVLIMDRSKAPVVPVKVRGTNRLLRGGRGGLRLVVGKPLTLDQLKAPEGVANRREWVAERIMRAIDEL
ncbi:1-acylglycerol-3-phosphate O-acyltransferase [Acididesulfobacillus acetoxydans]|uniref:1-acyl-sn-glycerol-3-phosphate acyltransferase n=1 Tax=Acididesulfobacillus acetoxydans TaxID=1561005 RepID=A0A8S0VXL7_9FIRM|nr:lysophospholipid acyltransferase family protein [Acididesulfobacillus acetoxydans]CAA7602033.1 1-acylglycerol-3-phosphate O-acyltransferase [Acididesulfobacillus acetoxydans]CEJ08124.1 1-acyl-sn-glycerol-3-phosphate acyltransferase [Acididesulfobacillus acetoxydans]